MINWFAETVQAQGGYLQEKAYGAMGYKPVMALLPTPGLASWVSFSSTPTGTCWTGSRLFVAAAGTLWEVASDGTKTSRGTIVTDGNPASMAFSSIQVMIASAGKAYCFDLTSDTLTDVSSQMAGNVAQVKYSDGYFIASIQNSNKFQISSPLDGTTWPGLYVNEVSVFPDNIASIEVAHRELWIFGDQGHTQPYYDSGSDSVFDVISGALIEHGSAATFGPCLVDNAPFWVSRDIRGTAQVWRANGYNPQRISTYAVEVDLGQQAQLSGLVSYAYQDGGHTFWVLYIPGSSWSWVYDVGENLWHKRASWNGLNWGPHWSWNHVYAFGKHLVGDWNSGNLWQMAMPSGVGGVYSFVTDNGTTIRRLRRSPTAIDEMQWVTFAELTLDFQAGLGPQPPLTDGSGNPRPPQVMLRWSNDRGNTWSNEHICGAGMAGEYLTRVIFRRLGRARYRIWEMSVSDPIPWYFVGDYLRAA